MSKQSIRGLRMKLLEEQTISMPEGLRKKLGIEYEFNRDMIKNVNFDDEVNFF